MSRHKNENKMKLWALRLTPDLLIVVKQKGYKAAAWVRMAMREKLKREIRDEGVIDCLDKSKCPLVGNRSGV